jgi:uncharacterized protein (TIGR03000 family)
MYAKLIVPFAVLAALVLAGSALAGGPMPGQPSGWPPWQIPGWQGYREPHWGKQPPAVVTAPPVKYQLVVTVVPREAATVDADRVALMGHVPEDAVVWIQGAPTTSTGEERYYISPPLEAGQEYHYLVRVAWVEDGQWVAKDAKIAVKAGEEHCFFLQKAATVAEKEAAIQANLAKLTPEDRKLAEAQKFCVVESDTRLGAVGVPVKVMVKDEPVFVCCKNCVKEAQADPDKTLAKVKELKAKAAEPPPK